MGIDALVEEVKIETFTKVITQNVLISCLYACADLLWSFFFFFFDTSSRYWSGDTGGGVGTVRIEKKKERGRGR